MKEFKAIKATYDSYQGLVEAIGADKIEGQFNRFYDMIQDFLKQVDPFNRMFKINRRILLIAVLDYFADIERLKSFHRIEGTNQYKNKAYEATWFLRRKPIQSLDDESTDEKFDYINEQFIYCYLVSFLFDGRDISESKDRERLNGFFDSLMYYLKFRNCEAQPLELMLISFKAGEIVNETATPSVKEKNNEQDDIE